VAVGQRVRVVRVGDEDAGLLRYLASLGIRPGVVVTLAERAPFDGPLTLAINGATCQVGASLAARVHVEHLGD
ncbi:MAG TPA: FeoA family protein, partial [Gemmatimonadaceae bacterium]